MLSDLLPVLRFAFRLDTRGATQSALCPVRDDTAVDPGR